MKWLKKSLSESKEKGIKVTIRGVNREKLLYKVSFLTPEGEKISRFIREKRLVTLLSQTRSLRGLSGSKVQIGEVFKKFWKDMTNFVGTEVKVYLSWKDIEDYILPIKKTVVASKRIVSEAKDEFDVDEEAEKDAGRMVRHSIFSDVDVDSENVGVTISIAGKDLIKVKGKVKEDGDGVDLEDVEVDEEKAEKILTWIWDRYEENKIEVREEMEED